MTSVKICHDSLPRVFLLYPTDKLKELKQLLDDGIVDEDEFNKLKDEIING